MQPRLIRMTLDDLYCYVIYYTICIIFLFYFASLVCLVFDFCTGLRFVPGRPCGSCSWAAPARLSTRLLLRRSCPSHCLSTRLLHWRRRARLSNRLPRWRRPARRPECGISRPAHHVKTVVGRWGESNLIVWIDNFCYHYNCKVSKIQILHRNLNKEERGCKNIACCTNLSCLPKLTAFHLRFVQIMLKRRGGNGQVEMLLSTSMNSDFMGLCSPFFILLGLMRLSDAN